MNKNRIPYAIIAVILTLCFIFWFFSVYSSYKEKSIVCQIQGGVLVNVADGFEDYACIKSEAIFWSDQ